MVRHGPTWFAMVQVRHCPICSDIFSDMTCVRAWVSEVRGRVSGRGLFPLLLRHWEGECQAKKFLRNETTTWAKNEMGDNACGGPCCTHHPPLLPGYSPNPGFDHLSADPLPIGRSLTRPHVNHPVQKSIQPRVARFLSGEVGGRGVSL